MTYDLFLYENPDNKIINRYILSGETESIFFLPNIKSINIFVGANNSGKSWLMRHLMEMKDYHKSEWLILKELMFEFNNILVDDIYVYQRNDLISYSVSAPQININRYDILKDMITLDKVTKNKENFDKLLNFSKGYWDYFNEFLDEKKIDKLNILNIKIYDIIKKNQKIENVKKYLIPTLRTAHSLYDSKERKIEEDIFLNTLNKNYPNKNVKIFTGLHLYKSILNSRNARKEIRKRFEDFETFIQENFFDGKKIDIVAEFDKDKSLNDNNSDEIISIHIDGENETRMLHELGDGIQAIIILMYQIFMAEENSVIFIDEPELNLHPGMQRLFFEQISFNKDLTKKKLTYFISTHSNHLLDLTLENDDVSIYSFNPIIENGNKKIIIKNVDFGNTELLRDLGVNNTSVFLANSSIWVEGISDRNYIKSFLKAYCDDVEGRVYPKEDIYFTFFEYAGGNIEHYILGEKFNDDE